MRNVLVFCAAAALISPPSAPAQQRSDPAGRRDPVSDAVLEKWRALSGHSQLVRCLAFAADGRLASGGKDRLVCVWSADGELLHQIDLRPDGA